MLCFGELPLWRYAQTVDVFTDGLSTTNNTSTGSSAQTAASLNFASKILTRSLNGSDGQIAEIFGGLADTDIRALRQLQSAFDSAYQFSKSAFATPITVDLPPHTQLEPLLATLTKRIRAMHRHEIMVIPAGWRLESSWHSNFLMLHRLDNEIFDVYTFENQYQQGACYFPIAPTPDAASFSSKAALRFRNVPSPKLYDSAFWFFIFRMQLYNTPTPLDSKGREKSTERKDDGQAGPVPSLSGPMRSAEESSFLSRILDSQPKDSGLPLPDQPAAFLYERLLPWLNAQPLTATVEQSALDQSIPWVPMLPDALAAMDVAKSNPKAEPTMRACDQSRTCLLVQVLLQGLRCLGMSSDHCEIAQLGFMSQLVYCAQNDLAVCQKSKGNPALLVTPSDTILLRQCLQRCSSLATRIALRSELIGSTCRHHQRLLSAAEIIDRALSQLHPNLPQLCLTYTTPSTPSSAPNSSSAPAASASAAAAAAVSQSPLTAMDTFPPEFIDTVPFAPFPLFDRFRLSHHTRNLDHLAGRTIKSPIYRPVQLTLVPEREALRSWSDIAQALGQIDHLCMLMQYQTAHMHNTYALRCSLISHFFTQSLPLPSPALVLQRYLCQQQPEDSPFLRAFSHSLYSQPLSSATQTELLRLIHRVVSHFVSTVMSIRVTRSFDATRIITMAWSAWAWFLIFLTPVFYQYLRVLRCSVPNLRFRFPFALHVASQR